MSLKFKRIYDDYEADDGFRILVDRLWPRGIKKENAKIDLWAKDITPSNQLRKDYHSGMISWDVFAQLYYDEIQQSHYLPEFLSEIKKHENVTLLYAAREAEHSHTQIIRKVIEEQN